jgi:hypothetical protein
VSARAFSASKVRGSAPCPLRRQALRAAVEDLQGGDFVLVLGDEALERFHRAPGALAGGLAEVGFDQLVLRDGVDDLLGLLLERDQQLAQGGVAQGFHGALHQLLRLAGRQVGRGVGVQGVHQAARQVFQAVAAAGGDDLVALGGGEFAVQPGQAGGDAAQHLGLHVAQRHGLQQFVEGHGLLHVHGGGVGLVLLAHAHAIDDDEVVLGAGVGGHGLQVGGRDDAHAPAFHLLEEVAAFHARMNMTISTGLMSVPVAIMSTVTAMRGK